jgi:hypothetical protein
MSIHYIDEPYRQKIIDILSTDDSDDTKQSKLKLYLIASEPSWLTREIIKDFNK